MQSGWNNRNSRSKYLQIFSLAYKCDIIIKELRKTRRQNPLLIKGFGFLLRKNKEDKSSAPAGQSHFPSENMEDFMNGTERVKLSKVIEKMQLTNLTPDVDTSGIWLHIPEVNRPALQLTGFYNQFDNDRIQIIGNVEYSYLSSLSETDRYERYMQLLSSNIPCLVFCRDLEPEAKVIELATKYKIPILKSKLPHRHLWQKLSDGLMYSLHHA